MTINELIDQLEEYRDSIDGDAEVRMMTQAQWPFEYTIAGITSGEEINTDPLDAEDDNDVEDDNIVYIVEGQQLKYGSKRAWDLVR